MKTNHARRLKELERENGRMKRRAGRAEAVGELSPLFHEVPHALHGTVHVTQQFGR